MKRTYSLLLSMLFFSAALSATPTIVEILPDNFEQEVLQSPLPVIIKVFATWCPPCQMVLPIYQKTAELFEGKVKFVALEVVEQNIPFLEENNIDSIPTFMIYYRGKQIIMRSGAPASVELFSDFVQSILDAVAQSDQ